MAANAQGVNSVNPAARNHPLYNMLDFIARKEVQKI